MAEPKTKVGGKSFLLYLEVLPSQCNATFVVAITKKIHQTERLDIFIFIFFLFAFSETEEESDREKREALRGPLKQLIWQLAHML